MSTFLHEMLFFSSTPLFFSLSHFSKFSQLISETKEISFNSPLFGRVGVLYVLQFWRMISKWFISFLKRVLIQIFFQKYVFYFLNVLSLYLCWRGEGRKGNWWILFCPFVILGSNVSMAYCLSKREFRDCQKFFENRRSSDWSTRKAGFSFLLFEISLMIYWNQLLWKKKRKTALFEATEGGHFDIITLLVERGASINFRDNVCFLFFIFFLFFECLVFIFMLEGGGGERGIDEILFCPFVILVSNVSISCCLSKREFRDCQNFFENKRSSDWSTRKKGFFFSSFLLFEISLMILKKKGKTALFEATEGGHFDIITLLVEGGASINFRDNVCFFFYFFFYFFFNLEIWKIFYFYFLNVLCLFVLEVRKRNLRNFILPFYHFSIECLHFMLLVKKGI